MLGHHKWGECTNTTFSFLWKLYFRGKSHEGWLGYILPYQTHELQWRQIVNKKRSLTIGTWFWNIMRGNKMDLNGGISLTSTCLSRFPRPRGFRGPQGSNPHQSKRRRICQDALTVKDVPLPSDKGNNASTGSMNIQAFSARILRSGQFDNVVFPAEATTSCLVLLPAFSFGKPSSGGLECRYSTLDKGFASRWIELNRPILCASWNLVSPSLWDAELSSTQLLLLHLRRPCLRFQRERGVLDADGDVRHRSLITLWSCNALTHSPWFPFPHVLCAIDCEMFATGSLNSEVVTFFVPSGWEDAKQVEATVTKAENLYTTTATD